jgi:branched-chain amino acid transport system substrate-binding protein
LQPPSRPAYRLQPKFYSIFPAFISFFDFSCLQISALLSRWVQGVATEFCFVLSPFSIRGNRLNRVHILTVLMLLVCAGVSPAKEPLKIGMNYPQSGPYAAIGIDEERAAQMAMMEINRSGGILGREVQVCMRDSKSEPDVAEKNVLDLIDNTKVQMVFGGASSGVAIRVSGICQKKKTLFMATVTSANETTGIDGHRYTFRVCYNAWMGAKAEGTYLKKHFAGEKFFYIVSDYSWGRSAENSIRRFSGTMDKTLHRVSYTKFPDATEQNFRNSLRLAMLYHPDVLVLCQFGQDMVSAIREAAKLGLKKRMQIVVPILELSMCEGAGPEIMEGVVGTSDFNWRVPYAVGAQQGIEFVEKFGQRYGRYPCWGAASAYTILWEYKSAVERAGSFKAEAVIRALEGHNFSLLKGEQQWRDFDHQNVQDVYLIRCKPAEAVLKDKYGQDFFEIIDRLAGPAAVQTDAQWKAVREKAGLPGFLEKLPGGKN